MAKGFKDKDGKFHPTETVRIKPSSEAVATSKFAFKIGQQTTEDLKKLKESRIEEDEMEFELNDILEDVTGKNSLTAPVDFQTLDKVARDNIEFVLKREGKWGKNFGITFPMGGLFQVRDEDHEEKESGFYQIDFDLFSDIRTIAYSGTAYGTISAGDMIDMTVEIKKVDDTG